MPVEHAPTERAAKEAANMDRIIPIRLTECNSATSSDEPEVLIIESAAVEQRAEWDEWARTTTQSLLKTGYWRTFRFGPVLRLRHVAFCN